MESGASHHDGQLAKAQMSYRFDPYVGFVGGIGVTLLILGLSFGRFDYYVIGIALIVLAIVRVLLGRLSPRFLVGTLIILLLIGAYLLIAPFK